MSNSQPLDKTEALHQFVYSALKARKNKLNPKNYNLILKQIQLSTTNPCNTESTPEKSKFIYTVKKDKQFSRWLIALSKCSTVLDASKENQHGDLLKIIFHSNWLASLTTVQALCEFMVNLIMCSSSFLYKVICHLVRVFLLPFDYNEGQYLELPKDERPLTLDELQREIHRTIGRILRLMPSFMTNLFGVLTRKFPHQVCKSEQHQLYIKNLLWITEYAPALRGQILTLITERLIHMDVEVGGKTDGLDDEKVKQDNADKMDSLLCILLEYLKLVNDHGPPLADEVFKSLLLVFERSILRTHKSRFIQFLIFYHCSFKQSYAECFLRFLLHKLFHNECPIVDRMSCASYISSFVSRASYLSAVSILSTFESLIYWLSAYSKSHIEIDIVGAANAEQHKLFYGICQAFFSIFVFRQKLFSLVHERNSQKLQGLNFWNIIVTPMNPMRFCDQQLVLDFSIACLRLDLGDFTVIIRDNEKLDRCIFSSSSSSPSPSLSSSSSLSSLSSLSSSSKSIPSVNQWWELLTLSFEPFNLPLSSEYINDSIYFHSSQIHNKDAQKDEKENKDIPGSPVLSFNDLMTSKENDGQPNDADGSNLVSQRDNTDVTFFEENQSTGPVDAAFKENIDSMNISPNLTIRTTSSKVPTFKLDDLPPLPRESESTSFGYF